MWSIVRIKSWERGLKFVRGEFRAVLGPGKHVVWPLLGESVEIVSTRELLFEHAQLDIVLRSGQLDGELQVVELGDRQRALVFREGRFERILGPGRWALWSAFYGVRVEVLDTEPARFEHAQLGVVLGSAAVKSSYELVEFVVPHGHVGLAYLDGDLHEQLAPGRHAFWSAGRQVRQVLVDLRQTTLDIQGQELMTADRVSLRINAVATYVVAEPRRAMEASANYGQALYREAQLVLRAVVGTRSLDQLLGEKDAVARLMDSELGERAQTLGLRLDGFGIKDVILPGEMKALLNQVMEARKAAEAAVITRREETAAMRSQANTAKLLEANPTLMRLKELEVLQAVAKEGDLTVVLGEQGLSDKLMKLL